jgi:hypothetical protein
MKMRRRPFSAAWRWNALYLSVIYALCLAMPFLSFATGVELYEGFHNNQQAKDTPTSIQAGKYNAGLEDSGSPPTLPASSTLHESRHLNQFSDGAIYDLLHIPIHEWSAKLWVMAVAILIVILYCLGCLARNCLPCCFYSRCDREYQYTDGYGHNQYSGRNTADRSFAQKLLCLICCWECCCDENNNRGNGRSTLQELLCCFCCFELCCDSGRIAGDVLISGGGDGYRYGTV